MNGVSKAAVKRDMKFYVLQVEDKMTDRIRKDIRKKALIENLEHLVSKVLIPRVQETQIDKQTGKPKIVNRRRFPGYLIVKAYHCDETFHLINSVRGVMGYLPHRDLTLLTKDEKKDQMLLAELKRPVPLDSEEAAFAVITSKKVKTSEVYIEPKFKWNDEVTIVAGQFKGQTGKIISINTDSYDVEIKVLGVPTRLKSLGLWQLRKVS